MFQLLLGNVYPNSRAFQFSMLCHRGSAQQTGKEHSEDSWPALGKGIFHSTEHHSQYINCGKMARRCQFLPGDKLGIDQWMLSNCSVQNLFFLWFIPLFPPFLHYYYCCTCYYILLHVIIKLFLTRGFFRWVGLVSEQLHSTYLPAGVKTTTVATDQPAKFWNKVIQQIASMSIWTIYSTNHFYSSSYS